MVLVTGGAGLVGRELITQLLAQGKTVRAIYNRTIIADIADPKFQQLQCDILDVVMLEEVMEAVDELYHCAGVITYDPKETARLFKINVEGTANVVNAALIAGVRKMVHVSSISAIGRPAEPGSVVNEDMDWGPRRTNSKYGHSKYLGELEVWRGIAEGLSAVIVNPSVILGAGNWNEGSTAIFKTVYNEFPWYSEGITGFVDVRDVAKAMILLMDSGITSQRFILNAENESYKKVFNLIALAFNKRPASKKVTSFLAAVIWRVEAFKSLFTGKAAMVTKETARTAISTQKFDNRKLLELIPSFSYHTLHDTITYTCGALQQKLNKQ